MIALDEKLERKEIIFYCAIMFLQTKTEIYIKELNGIANLQIEHL